MSTYSPDLRIELITTGDQAGTWGTTTNTNLSYVIEQAIAGYISVAVASANQALTYINGGSATAALNQSVHANIALTTSTGANFAVYAPPASKQYTIYNASSYTATIYNSTVIGNTTAAGTGVAIPAGKTVTVWSDGTNFVFQNNHLSSLTLATDLAVADGGTGASTAADARTNLGVTATGQDTTYLFRANNLSDLASSTTARTNLGLGTMATQAASSVSITGGSITGITDLAVADGGTGASTAANARTNLGVTATGQDTTYAYRANNLSDLASASTARTNLGLGTMATQASSNVSITGGSITGITDLAVADGGTGSSTASGARTNLGLGALAVLNTVSTATIDDASVTPAKLTQPLTATSEVTLSGSSTTIATSIPTWVKRITISFYASTDATGNLYFQLGAPSASTDSYYGTTGRMATSSVGNNSYDGTGFQFSITNTGDWVGILVLTKMPSNKWVGSGSAGLTTNNYLLFTNGYKDITNPTAVYAALSSGSFDGGSASILYE
jgi:hypothetical protein